MYIVFINASVSTIIYLLDRCFIAEAGIRVRLFL